MTILFLFLFSTLYISGNSSGPAMIHWNESQKLNYIDFKGSVPFGTPWAATTSSMIHFEYETLNEKISGFSVYASFIPAKSWMKKKIPSVLTHEQLHFDITEIFARKLYADCLSDSLASKETVSNFFKQENRACDEMQQQYDKETDHGTVEETQKQWGEKVRQMLEENSPYPAPDLTESHSRGKQ